MFIKSLLGGVTADELLKAGLKLFSNEECAEIFKNESSLMNGIIDSQLCAGDSTKDACQVPTSSHSTHSTHIASFSSKFLY